MSLDGQHPTEYFGPDAVTFTAPNGKRISVSEEHWRRLTAAGALTKEQMLNAVQHGKSLQDVLDEANGVITLDDMDKGIDPVYGDLFHRPGCSVQRTGRCLCDFLSQWDSKPALNLPAGEPEDKLEEKDYYPQVNKDGLKRLTVNGEIWGPIKEPALGFPVVISTIGDPAEIAERIVRQNPDLFGELPDGTYPKPEPDLARDLSDEKLRTKYWHGEYKHARRGFWLAVAFAAVCAAALGTVLAWAGVL